MRFLVIGLGSMGKRRIRCLKKLRYENIIGFDPRKDRREEVVDKYGVKVINDLQRLDFDRVDVIIIATPPDSHNEYIRLAIKERKPAFVEASVVLKGLEELNMLAKKENIFIAPSCTMKFHRAIKDIKNIVKSGKYGKITNFSYHSGQYLPDWHPWENLKDFYVSKKETGAAREIVPFELTWIVDLIGFPKHIIGFYGKTMDIGVDIDDTYVILLKFDECYGSLIVDVVSRYAIRNLILNMEYGQIIWKWDERAVKLYDTFNERWIYYYYLQGQTVEGYNQNIIEDMYVDELKAFIDTIKGKSPFPNSLDEDIKVLKLLEQVEKSYEVQ